MNLCALLATPAASAPIRTPIISPEDGASHSGFAHSMEVKMMDLTTITVLNVQDAADYLKLRKRKLDSMGWMGTDPAFNKHNGCIFYRAEELQR
jgi:hypothetical protein